MTSAALRRDAPAASSPAWPAWRVLAAFAAWLACLAWARALALPDEGRYAGVAWEMLRADSPLVPLLDGMPYFHKPPLYYWLAQLSYAVFGLHAWSARLPSLLAAWCAGAGLYAFVRRYRDPHQARLSVLALGLMPLYYGAAQFANLDMLVAALISLAVLAAADTALRRSQGRPYRAMSLAAAALAALAVLAKGLIGVALPGAIVLGWLCLRRDGAGMRALLWWPALALFAVLAVPWFWFMQVRYPDFFHYFFVYQQLQRFSQGGFNNAQPFWFYLPVLAGLCLPWSAWALAWFRRAFWREADPQGLRRLALIWMAVVVAFFSMPQSKLIGYVLPALPAAALLLGEVIAPRWAAGSRRPVRLAAAGASALCAAAIAIAAAQPRHSASAAARALRGEMQGGDVIVTLHAYPFDLGFYTRSANAPWVVDDWSDPDIARRDNWRKELKDAAGFDPAMGARNLVSEAQWRERLCAAPDGARFWVWGVPEDARRYPALAGLAPVYAQGRRAVWRLEADAALRQRLCGG